jgi:hypothetical protein
VVSITAGAVRLWREVPGVQPAIMLEEFPDDTSAPAAPLRRPPQRVPTGWMEAVISLLLVDFRRFVRTSATRQVTSCARTGSDSHRARNVRASNSKASTGPTATAPKAASPQGATTGPVAFRGCLASHGIREAITYQPASRYWRFQATETAIYLALALALALAGSCFRRLSRLS